MRMPSLWCEKHRGACTTRLRRVKSYLMSYTHRCTAQSSCTWQAYPAPAPHVSIFDALTPHAQVNKADGCGANEQQKQQKQKKTQQMQQKEQKQQQEQKQQKQHTGGSKTRVSMQELRANAMRPARQDLDGVVRRS